MLLLSDVERTGSDFPPTFKLYVCPLKSEKEMNISPSLKVTGLGEGCSFQLITPSEFESIVIVRSNSLDNAMCIGQRSISSASASISSSSGSFVHSNTSRVSSIANNTYPQEIYSVDKLQKCADEYETSSTKSSTLCKF